MKKSGWNGLWAVGSVVVGMGGMSTAASEQMRITEWQYSGGDLTSEFIEFTNVGLTPINMTGWSYDDDSRIPGSVSLSAFGTVAPGQSVILCESTAAAFIAAWNLSGVTVIGGNSNNLGRNDEINLYDHTGTLVDRLTYGDQTFPGSVRTNGRSGWPCAQALGANNAYGWRLSQVGDSQNSFFSSYFDIGSPGTYTSFTCPADPTGACCSGGACTILTQAECTAEGLYQGDGTNCSPNLCPAPSGALVRITEFMHTGAGGEFFEIRNFGASPVNLAGWHYSDETRAPGQVSLSSLGTLAGGEVAIVTEIPAGDFRTDWGLSPAVKVQGGNTVNLGSADEINIYDHSGALVDRLTFGHVTCSPDANGMSVWPCSGAVGNNHVLEWRRSLVGDAQGSHTSIVGDIGNPGLYTSVGCTTGSCCTNNVCAVKSLGDCVSGGGLYLGEGTNCGTTPCPPADTSSIRVTEFMYQGVNGEFLEITNLGTTPVNLTGWSFADSCEPPDRFSLSGLGTLNPGQSGIVTDKPVATFQTAWNLSGVPIIQIPSSELGRNDQIGIYNPSKARADLIRYGDQTFPGTVQTQNVSAWPIATAIGADKIGHWIRSTVGDAQGSYASTGGDVGNPGVFTVKDIPAASTWGMIVFALLVLTAGTMVARRRAAILRGR